MQRGSVVENYCASLGMGLPSAGTKQFQQKPPDKGSFPLDHQGYAAASTLAYWR